MKKHGQPKKQSRTDRRKSKSARGASRRVESVSYSRVVFILLKMCFAVSVIAAFAGAIWYFEPTAKLAEATNRPIAGISIESEFKYIDEEKIQNIVADYITETFLELNIKALKTGLEEHAWVDKVSVSRRWPDRLVIKVIEQQPIARWGTHHFLNMRGDIVSADGENDLSHLPLLTGLNDQAQTVMQQYLLMGKLLQPYNFYPVNLKLDPTLAWTTTLRYKSTSQSSVDIEVVLGRTQAVEKVRRLMSVMQRGLVDQITKISHVDMRYRNGFAVGWNDESFASTMIFDQGNKKSQKTKINNGFDVVKNAVNKNVRRESNGTI